MLFLSSRARRDIQTAVSFLTMRVKKPDEDDWGKLKRALKFLNGTTRLKLTLTIKSMGVINGSLVDHITPTGTAKDMAAP